MAAASKTAGADARLLLLGGDCTSHTAAMAGLKRRSPKARLAIAWFDAHGDFNIPTTTPSGNVWGMPFAMLCGRGDAGSRRRVLRPDRPGGGRRAPRRADPRRAGVADARGVAGRARSAPGCSPASAGLAALEAWARVVGERCDGLYIAFDLDAIDASEGLSVAMPERGGLSAWTAVVAVRLLAATTNVVGFGATAAMRRPGLDLQRTVDVVAQLAEAAFG